MKNSKINTTELKEFIQEVTQSIASVKIDLRKEKDDIDDYYLLDSSLDFEISVAIQKTANGKINLLVADVGADYKKEVLSKIKFKMDSLGNRHRVRRERGLERLSRNLK